MGLPGSTQAGRVLGGGDPGIDWHLKNKVSHIILMISRIERRFYKHMP